MISADEASLLMRRAILLQEQGQHRRAYDLYAKITKSYPDHPDVQHNAGLAKFALGEFESAENLLLSALRLRRDFGKARSNLVKLWTRMDRAETLKEIAKDAAWVVALDFDANMALGQYFQHRGEHRASFMFLTRCVDAKPADAQARHLLGVTLHRLNRAEEAEVHLREALKLSPDNPAVLTDLSRCLFSMHMKTKRLDFHAEGRSLIEQAVKLAPDLAPVRHQMGVVHEEDGDFEQARQSYSAALTATPDYLPALTSLAALSRNALPQTLMDDLQSSLQKGHGRFPVQELSRAHQALGKCHDARGAFDLAFEHFRLSNALALNPLPYDRQHQEAYTRNLIATYSAPIAHHDRMQSDEVCRPIFIVGMPRSGTTLLEHMLSSHPDIVGAGELPFFSSLELEGGSSHDRNGKQNPDWTEENRRDKIELLRSEFNALIVAAGADSRWVIDKMPFNFWHIGMIIALYPDARILHCTRDSRDVGLSCYIESFSEFHSWSLNLSDIGHYYCQYEHAMSYWTKLFKNNIFNISYRSIVENTDQVIRDTMEFLGMPWEGSVKSYNDVSRTIQTPSNWQVRQPVYLTSLERWRGYEHHLAPLIEVLSAGDGASIK